MNKRNLHIDLIEKYLGNTMDIAEVALFNETLENNEEFVRELNDMELLVAGIKKEAATTTIEEKLDRFNKSIKIMIKTFPKSYFLFVDLIFLAANSFNRIITSFCSASVNALYPLR